MNNLNGLAKVHVELSSRCLKNCHICGRRLRDNQEKDLIYGDMSLDLIKLIARQIPSGIIIATHWNGESMLSPVFGEAIKIFKDFGCITNTVTNGQHILEKFDEVVDNLDTLSISIFQGDPEREIQYKIIKEFLEKKGERKPFTTLRLIGEVDDNEYKRFNCLIIRRLLHSPKGSFNYQGRNPTIPEHGICLDFLNTLAINYVGDVSVCVRFDPKRKLLLGNILDSSLVELWNCQKRKEMKRLHILGRRNLIEFCNSCDYYGVPSGF